VNENDAEIAQLCPISYNRTTAFYK